MSHRNVFKFKNVWKVAVALVVVLVLAVLLMGGEESAANVSTYRVPRGDLPIRIIEGGSVESLNPNLVKCEVKGRQVKILQLVEEGYRITKKDIENDLILVELDSSELEDQIMEQEIQYQNTKAALSKAQQDYDIQEKQNDSDIKAAERAAKFKAMDLQKYLGEVMADALIAEVSQRRRAEKVAEDATRLAVSLQAARQRTDATEAVLESAVDATKSTDIEEEERPVEIEATGLEMPVPQPRPDSRADARRPRAPGDAAGMDEDVLTVMAAMEARKRGEVPDIEELKRTVEQSREAVARLEEELAAKLQVLERTVQEAQGQCNGFAPDDAPYAVVFDAYDFRSLGEHPDLGGEAAQKRDNLETNILLANEELITAEKNLEGTHKLRRHDFVTERELERDELAVKRKRIDIESDKTSKDLFVRYEFPKQAEESLSDYEESLRKLDRTVREAETKLLNAEVSLNSAEARFAVQGKRRHELREQLEKCVIYAQHEGLVVYGDGRNRRYDEPLQVGSTVHEQMTLLTIPDITEMAVVLKVHESAIKKVARGQNATVTVEAFPNTRLRGSVTKVGVLPSSQNRWMNPDLKVYEVTVSIEGDNDWLRPGMTAEVEVDIATLEDVMYVPIQAVHSRGDDTVCYLAGGLAVPVTTGQMNDTHVEIRQGLELGQEILLRRPRGASAAQTGGREREESAPRVDSPVVES